MKWMRRGRHQPKIIGGYFVMSIRLLMEAYLDVMAKDRSWVRRYFGWREPSAARANLGGKATWLDRGILDVGDGFDRERHREAMCDIFVEELEGLRLIGRG